MLTVLQVTVMITANVVKIVVTAIIRRFLIFKLQPHRKGSLSTRYHPRQMTVSCQEIPLLRTYLYDGSFTLMKATVILEFLTVFIGAYQSVSTCLFSIKRFV